MFYGVGGSSCPYLGENTCAWGVALGVSVKTTLLRSRKNMVDSLRGV